ncbi:MAG: IS1 family transposase, partial [Methanomicrobiales archaeon]|nr:IS1 family transposase [Methanomicrobiales archaeon]
MASVAVTCPICRGTHVIKHGVSSTGTQRYYCKDS